MRIVIIEDEQIFADNLKNIVREWAANNQALVVELIHYLSGEELIEAFKEGLRFEFAFLDITLPGIDGIEVSQQLRNLGYANPIVLTSNHKEYDYVQKGYDVGALNYFAKPITLEKVNKCMNVLQIGRFYEYYYNGLKISLPYDEIVFFQSKRNYINIHTYHADTNAPHFKCSMSELIETVPYTFVQTHRTYVVNIAHVSKIEGSTLFLKSLTEKFTIPISDTYLDNVVSTLRNL